MSTWTRMVKGETRIDFVGLSKRWFSISAVLIVVSLASLAIFGLNLGLEFRGGVAVQAENVDGADLEEIRAALAEIGQEGAQVQMINDGEGVRVETPPLDQDGQEELRQTVSDVTGSPRDELSVEAVAPRFGELIARQALIALSVFLTVVVLFISWRLEWKMALAGLAALVHDMIVTAGVYAITQFPVTSATVVAFLTILGYSLYDTVVVFDRVTENVEEAETGERYADVVNHSMNQVLVRSLATSLTSLLPVGSLLFVGSILLGAASLRDFALALFVGIASGTYSSLFVAAPLLARWKGGETIEADHSREERNRKKKAASEYTPRLTASGSTRPSGGSRRDRPPRPPKGER